MDRAQLVTLMDSEMGFVVGDDSQILRDLKFRSLDFSELALLVEETTGVQPSFDAATLRGLQTVGDLVEFFCG